MTKPTLEPPHSFLAAGELLRDLQARPELAPYILPDIWTKRDQADAIAALSQMTGAAVAVGLAETSLPAAGQRQQGGLVRVGLAVYVFQPSEGTLNAGPDEALREQVWLTVVRTLNSWYYTTPGGLKIKALLTAGADVDLSASHPDLAKQVYADALSIDIPLQLTMPRLPRTA